jgi:hypothetical protein
MADDGNRAHQCRQKQRAGNLDCDQVTTKKLRTERGHVLLGQHSAGCGTIVRHIGCERISVSGDYKLEICHGHLPFNRRQ